MIWALHGAVGSAADWRVHVDQFPTVFDGMRRVDLWRFLDCCPMSLAETGRALATEIARVDDDPVLLGYSMGGRIALHSLLLDPGMWKAAILVSAHPGLRDEGEKQSRRERDAEWSAEALKGDWGEFLERWETQTILQGDCALPDRMRLKDRRAAVARSFIDWSLGSQQDLRDELHRISCPVLWVTGENDVKFTALAEISVQNFPYGKHEIISDCGHRVPWERPEEFAACCHRFLTDNA